VFVLALPMLGEQFGNFLVGFVDVLLAGRVSMEATAAVGTGGYMGWFVTLAFTMLSIGTAALVSRSFGAKDLHTANRALNQSLLMALALGALVSAVVFVTAPSLATLLAQTDSARVLFTTYVRIDSLGYALFAIVLVCGGALRAAGDTRTPMMIMVAVNVINIIVSAGLVYGWMGLPKLGVTGIAIGTVTARSLGGVLMAGVLMRGLRGLQLRRDRWRPDFGIIRRIFKVGLPAAGDAVLTFITHMGFLLVVTHTAVGDAATVNYAAHTIGIRMEAISFLPAVAWMTASATLVGQYLGANRPELAARAGHTAAGQAALLTGAIGVAFYVFAEQIYSFMSSDPEVVAVGAHAFRIMAFVQPMLGMAIVYIGSLRGAGDTRATMIFSLIGGVCLRVPVAWLFGVYLGGGLLGAWIGMWCDNLAKFILGGGRFLHGGWKRIRV